MQEGANDGATQQWVGKDRVAYAQVVFTLVAFTLLGFYLWDTQEAEYVGPPIISC